MEVKSTDWRPGPSVCRCCLNEGCYKDIATEYFWMGKREVYEEMLSDTLNIAIAYSKSGGPNSNSRLICEPCIARLRDAFDFKRQVLECEKTFMQHLAPSSSKSALDSELEVPLEMLDSDVKLEHVKLEKPVSDDDLDDNRDFDNDDDVDDADDDDLDDEPLTKLATRLPKKESVDLMDLLDNTKASVKRKSSTKTKVPIIKKTKMLKTELTKPSPSKAAPKQEKKKKGFIQASDSTMTMKNKAGEEIKLIILKNPICLDTLECVNEKKINKKKYIRDISVRKQEKDKRLKENCDSKSEMVSWLKEPICLDKIEWKRENNESHSSVTFNVATVQGYLWGAARKKTKNFEHQSWKQNAIVIFEYSHVYPFIHSRNKYKCFLCPKTFLNVTHLEEHTSNEHSIEEMKTELNDRVRDKNLKVDVTNLKCKICLQTLPDLQNLKVHLKGHGKLIEPSLQDNIIPFKLDDDTFNCQICGERYLKLRLLIIHMSKHFNNYSCEICGAVFISLNLLRRHLQTHVSGNFPCDKCDKVFSNASKRTSHTRGVHLKQFPRRCPICPERFNSNYQRTKHLRIVHNQSTGLYRCDTCGREYDLKYHLLKHIRAVHLREKNHVCPVCHSRFFAKFCLSRHMLVHTGDKKN